MLSESSSNFFSKSETINSIDCFSASERFIFSRTTLSRSINFIAYHLKRFEEMSFGSFFSISKIAFSTSEENFTLFSFFEFLDSSTAFFAASFIPFSFNALVSTIGTPSSSLNF